MSESEYKTSCVEKLTTDGFDFPASSSRKMMVVNDYVNFVIN